MSPTDRHPTERARPRRHPGTPPPAWSPPALAARLDALRALSAMPHSRTARLYAGTTIARITADVNARRLAQDAAADRLRALADRLDRLRRSEAATQTIPPWQQLSGRGA